MLNGLHLLPSGVVCACSSVLWAVIGKCSYWYCVFPAYVYTYSILINKEVNMSKEKRSYLVVSELVKRFGRSQVTINTWIDKGFFPNAKKAGPFKSSEWRIPQTDVDALEKSFDTVSV